MTIKKLLSRSWQFKDVITTTQTFAAKKLPVPPRPFVLSKGGPAPLVTGISNCQTFDVSCIVVDCYGQVQRGSCFNQHVKQSMRRDHYCCTHNMQHGRRALLQLE